MSFLKKLSVYTFTSLVSAGVPFLILPLLSFHLTPSDYGNIRLFNLYVAFLIPILTLTSYSIAAIEFYKTEGQPYNDLFKTSFIIPLVNIIPILIVLLLFRYQIEKITELSFYAIIGVVIVSLSNSIYEHFGNMLIQQKKAVIYGLLLISKTLIESGLTILFIIKCNMGWEGRIYSWAIVVVLGSFTAIIYFSKQGWLKGSIYWFNVKKTLIFGLPLVLHQLGKFVINQSDTYFITKMVSLKDAGIYSFGYQFGTIVMMASAILLNIYNPFLFERLNKINEFKKKEIVKFSYLFLMVVFFVLIGVSVLSPIFFKLYINAEFYASTKFIFLTGLSYFFWSCYLMFSGVIFFYQKTMYLLYISLINISLNLALNYILISNYGVIGASFSTLISFFLTMVLTFFVSNHLLKLPWLSLRFSFSKNLTE